MLARAGSLPLTHRFTISVAIWNLLSSTRTASIWSTARWRCTTCRNWIRYSPGFSALKPGGSLVFRWSTRYTPAPRQGWLTDDNGERFWGVNHYQDEGKRVSNWLADGVKYHRTLGTTLNALIKAGLTLSEINEWGPTQAQIDAWPALAEEAERPMLVLISARKGQ
jgi:hypothetical protein